MKELDFVLQIDPPRTTSQQKAQNRWTRNFYKPAKLAAAENQYLWALKKHVPKRPLKGPLQVSVVLNFKTADHRRDGMYKTTKPDSDNAVKLLLDCMTKLNYWEDDALIADLHITKYWSVVPSVWVQAREIEGC